MVKFKDFQGRLKLHFQDQLSTEVYSMYSITATLNICLCDYSTALVDKNKTWQLLANLGLGKIPGRLKDRVDVSGNPVCIHGFMDDIVFAQNWPSKGDVRTYTQ